MKIHIVNPNTTASMTEKAVEAAQLVAASGTEIIGRQPDYGPGSIEGFYDEVFAIPGMLQEIVANNHCDGHVIACFDDTGLDAARCIARGPVTGLCESGCYAAMMIANRFSIVTTLSRSVPALKTLTEKYGAATRCASVRASDVPVLELEQSAGSAYEIIAREIELAIKDDGAEAILLGCAGMTSLAGQLSDQFSLPVIDGVSAAVKMTEGLVAMGLSSSRVNGYSVPLAKEYRGDFAKYAPQECL